MRPPQDGSWTVPAELDRRPLDGAIRALASVSWSDARRLIETGKVLVGSAVATSPRRRVLGGERIEVRLSAPRPETVRRRKLEGDLVVYADASVVVVNKPAGVSTIPYGDEDPAEQAATLDALVREVLAHRDRLRGRAPLGVVQRLDKGTSGLLVFARTLAAKKHLAQQLRVRSMHRQYLALAHGAVPRGTHRSYLVEDRGDGLRGSARAGRREGQLAVTHVEPIETLRGPQDEAGAAGVTLIACRLETGRTHQIRIHLAEAGHPLVGETVYVRDHRGPRIPAPRLMLHAAELGFDHPADDRPMRFQAPPPPDFDAVLERLRKPARQGAT
ncbi:RluA family pseudouridine synthase [Sorangium cellulosum]|uniref:RluA family pseudouridine synthase n=1 Tax=Sorangium cellulosum TaxID=56 RepID=UPI001F365513|nr:RluA family pseudouridine synthase [Sorangium cellulosum]